MASCINVWPYIRFISLTQRRLCMVQFSYKSILLYQSVPYGFCVHLNIARYVLSCSKYFEQLKTPCLCKRLSFPPKSESPPKLRCCFYDLDGAVLFFNHSLAASVSLYFALGALAVLDTVVQLHRPPTQGGNNFLGMMYDVWIPYLTLFHSSLDSLHSLKRLFLVLERYFFFWIYHFYGYSSKFKSKNS